jgi:hypothetical protein
MPFGKDPLNEKEIATIKQWIDQGARSSPGAAPAKAKWEPPLSLNAPPMPNSPWTTWNDPVDRFAAKYLAKQGVTEPSLISDAEFARRAYLDIWGLLPGPDQLRAFINDKSVEKRKRLVTTLLADNTKYSENWISFWNDLLRNDEGVVYYSETAARKSITPWLVNALQKNTPYNEWVAELLNPSKATDPDGFLIGVNWRGTVSASQTPALQAAQNTAQIFLGINLKCNSCHDSFISRWKLKDAYALASYFSPEDKLQLYRCDVAQQNQFATAAFLYPAINRTPASSSVADRRAAAAAIFIDPRNGRMPRTLVNRIWQKLMGRGFVEDVDDMDGEPWSPELLDWLANDFAASGFDLKHLIATVMSSRTYQLPAVARKAAPSKDYAIRGPEARRLTAEQFADAVASITGDWHVLPPAASKGPDIPAGIYSREWRIAGGSLTRALGRPIRDQVFSTRDTQPTTIQALELVNGESLTHWLWRGSRKMLGELPVEPESLLSRQVNSGSHASPIPFDLDISHSQKLYLIVQDALSTAPDKATPVWERASFIGPNGETPLSALKPTDQAGVREGSAPQADALLVKFPSVLVYNIQGKGFTRFRGAPGLEEVPLVQGENVQARFFIFDQQPSMDRLVPPNPATPRPEQPTLKTIPDVVDRVYWYALSRAPSKEERQIAETALSDPAHPNQPSPDALADLLWAVLMTPEFQFIR